MGRGAEHSAPLKVKYQRLQQDVHPRILMGASPGNVKSCVRKVLGEDTVLNMGEINVE